MPRRDFSLGHPRVGQWVWIDEGKPWQWLGVVQGPKHSQGDPTCQITREGRVTTVVSTAVLGGARRAMELALAAPPDVVRVALIDGKTGAQTARACADVEVDRLKPLLRKSEIPWPRRRLMAASWEPQP